MSQPMLPKRMLGSQAATAGGRWPDSPKARMTVLVSMVKLAKMAQIIPGVAVYSVTAFIFVMAAASAAIDPHEVWERWEARR